MRRLPAFFVIVCLAVLSSPASGGSPAQTQQQTPPSITWLEAPQGVVLTLPATSPAIPSPSQYLGYRLGSRFTPHERILGYLDALSASSKSLRQHTYGETYEGRPLRLAVITSPRNHERMSEIRAGLERISRGELSEAAVEAAAAQLPVVVWLSYGVHGNETSSAETALAVAYLLAAAEGEWASRLDQMIVILDPLVNPDGRERYLAGFEQRSGRVANPDADSIEHLEGWPSGRFNHYLFDLNRDLTWLTQQETQQRVAAYRTWEPQVHVDFHEMGRESSYFFPPAADPVNPEIDGRVISWLREFGKQNAAAFDRLGWVYYTRETYDLFYPGYGDAYPSLRGAVGMTYEVAGGGRAGTEVQLRDGSQLRLADRVARHLVTSLTTLETAYSSRRALLAGFSAIRSRNVRADSRTYFWKADQPEGVALAELLARHGVLVEQTSEPTEVEVTSLRGAPGQPPTQRRTLATGTIAVRGAQPLGSLVRALLELETRLAPEFVKLQRRRLEEGKTPEFYDVTAWSLPVGWNLDAWAGRETPRELRPWKPEGNAGGPIPGRLRGEGTLGVALTPQGLRGYRALTRLLAAHPRARLLTEEHHAGALRLPAGSVAFLARDASDPLFEHAAEIAAASGADLERISAGLAERGASLGSESAQPIGAVRVALVRGKGIDPTGFGALWSLFDRELELPHTVLDVEELGRVRLERFDTLVLPDGTSYGNSLGEAGKASLDRWVRGGGVLVAIGGAASWAKEAGLLELRPWSPPKADPEAEDAPAPASDPAGHAEQWIADQPIDTPGAILSTRLRSIVPLTAGIESPPSVLFSGSDLWLASGDPRRDVLVATEDPVIAGFAWPEARQRLAGALLVTRQEVGDGKVIAFAQDPAFRRFWRATMPLLLNAILFEPEPDRR